MMDIIGGEHRDPGMAVLGVVPGEERPAEGDGGGNVFEAAREVRRAGGGGHLRRASADPFQHGDRPCSTPSRRRTRVFAPGAETVDRILDRWPLAA